MQKKIVRLAALTLSAIISLSALAGCGGQKKEEAQNSSNTTATATGGEMYWDMFDKVSDTSDLPDWTGKKLKLRVWYSHGSNFGERPNVTDNVVFKEIARVTGVEIDVDKSFDNGGMDIKSKMPVLIAANDYPDLVFNGKMIGLEELIKGNKLYEVTDLFKKYCTEFTKKLPMDKYKDYYENNQFYNGKMYTLPAAIGMEYYYTDNSGYPDFDIERWKTNGMVAPASKGYNSGMNVLWVRDDLLKKLYPNARTMNEIEELYGKNGTFTKDEIFDVPLKNMDDVTKLFYDMKALIDKEGIKENGKPVKVTYGPYIGTDNWGWLTVLPTLIDGSLGNTNYFTQFNKKTGKLEYAYKMDYVVNEMKTYNKLIKDDVVSKDSIVDNLAGFTEKVNNGQYAVLYSQANPNAALQKAGKTFSYRPLWVEQQYREEQQAQLAQSPTGTAWGIFKDSVKEEDLPQVLEFFNYMYSDLGDKLMYWGPRSAGLFEEKNGKRVYKDKELEDCMVNSKSNGKNIYYGLLNSNIPQSTPFPGIPSMYAYGSVNHPKYVYDAVVNPAQAMVNFNPGILQGLSFYDGLITSPKLPNIYNYTAEVPEVDRFWKARDGFEKQLTKVIAASNEAQFNEQYKLLLQYAENNGLTDKTLDELNKVYLQINGDSLKKGGLIK